jgi:uncharacterized protein
MTLFVDTSAWYAAADGADRWHSRARDVLATNEPLLTNDHVLVESWLLLRHRVHREAAERFWEGLRAGLATIEMVVAVDLESAWAIDRQFPDQDFSLVDRVSFAMMERLGIDRVASFDGDFAVYRYGRGLNRAFEIVR